MWCSESLIQSIYVFDDINNDELLRITFICGGTSFQKDLPIDETRVTRSN